MRAILATLFFIVFSILNAQKTGIVYNINPKMGYVVFKGEIFTERPLLEKEIDYSLIDFLKNHYASSEVFSSFDFSQIRYFRADDLKYIRAFCDEHHLDQLLIITKNTDYLAYDPMENYKYLDHELGIETHKKFPGRATLYGNFQMHLYSISTGRAERKVNKVFILHRFKTPVFDKETYELTGKEATETFIKDLENHIKKKLEK